MRAGIQIEYANGTTETVAAVIPDLIAWERRTGRKASELGDGIGVEDLAYLAYSAATRNEVDRPDFDAWVETVATLEPVEDKAPKVTRRGR